MLTSLSAWLVSLSPAIRRRLWQFWYQILAARYQNSAWKFMNYGYAEIDTTAPEVCLDESDQPDRYSIQLYHHVLNSGRMPPAGADILEVGCGRGGGCSYMARYFQPRSVTGVDFSGQAIALCRKTYSASNLSFEQGDAEALPCRDGSFDVIVNVESSHCYGSMDTFLREVARVLRPGGYFLWADMRTSDSLDAVRQQLTGSGLELIADRRITPNVLRALDAMNDHKTAMILSLVPRPFRRGVRDFAGMSGSRLYEAMRMGQLEYISCALRKPNQA